jgi:glycosyltransferase involved in cell wall biosynthesis
MSFDSSTFGVIALAAYQPDWELFARQLRSIQAQTHANFHCLISADGGSREIRDFVDREMGGDDRFRVLGFNDRLGFYGNFERVLGNVPAEAEWVALSDQDDYWYPSKLELMVPHLQGASLVAGQARVVRLPGNQVITDSTARKNVSLDALLAQNQITGSLCIFRRELLELALPFPRLNTISQVHDHWLAVCAKSTDGVTVLDQVVQDYVQHGGNVLGEVGGRKSLFDSFSHLRALSRKYQGSADPLAMLNTAHELSFGWRRVMADALRSRVDRAGRDLEFGIAPFRTGHSWLATSRTMARGVRNGDIAMTCFAEFIAGLPVELANSGVQLLGRASAVGKAAGRRSGIRRLWRDVSKEEAPSGTIASEGTSRLGRVTIVLPGFSKYPVGGYKVAYIYANYLARQGYEVRLVHALLLWGAKRRDRDFRRPIGSFISALRPFGRPGWIELDSSVRCYTLPYLMPRLVQKTDFIVATEVQTARLVDQVARDQGIPGSYFIQHYEDWSASPEFIDETWKLPLRKIVIAPWLQDHMHSLGQEAVLVPNGIDPEEFPAGPPLAERENDVCAMISDVPWKRADLVVRVLNSQVEQPNNRKAVAFGTGDRPESLSHRVQYVKNPSKDQIRAMYQSSKIYLCASDGEGWHLPPAEAMSCGCAVVSTDIGGVRAYAENAALFSPVGEASGLQANVERLLNDPSLAQSLATRGLLDMRENSPTKAAASFEATVTGRS